MLNAQSGARGFLMKASTLRLHDFGRNKNDRSKSDPHEDDDS
jgi:hypothetical protein